MSIIDKVKDRLVNDIRVLFFYYPRATSLESFDARVFEDKVISYVQSRNIRGVEFSFSNSVKACTLYSSCYACMTLGLFDRIGLFDRNEWIEYFDSFQKDDGLFYDPATIKTKEFCLGDGWGARHLLLHLLIAYERLGGIPKKTLSFLEIYGTPDKMIAWLNGLDMNNIYLTSNRIMNIVCSMQYARDRMNAPLNDSIAAAEEWLLTKYNSDFGLWTNGKCVSTADYHNAVRGSYHLFPIFVYDGIDLPNRDETVKSILKTQNFIGGFDSIIASSACYDIDAIDPLVRFGMNNTKVMSALKKSFKWVMSNANDDGGFVFQRNNPFAYGGEPTLSSKANESNLFATWFRTLSILYLLDRMTESKNNILFMPGYELRINK